jgi:tRNA threonylcarbamoyladenosine modification (KEOPS) complex  Pcc1 subunit
MAFMIFLSTTWFRAKIYEPFLLIHIAMGIITIAALFW